MIAFTTVADPAVGTLAGELAAAPSDQGAVDAALATASGDDLATIIYTSGTTGLPKGVALSHRGFTHQLAVLRAQLPITPDDSSLSFLPLSHALERAWTFVVLASGCLNTYVPDPRTVAEQLVLARPTMLVSVPRLYEKVVTGAREKVAGSTPKRRLMAWALGIGARHHSAVVAGRQPSPLLRAQFRVADALVLRSIRNALGATRPCSPAAELRCGRRSRSSSSRADCSCCRATG